MRASSRTNCGFILQFQNKTEVTVKVVWYESSPFSLGRAQLVFVVKRQLQFLWKKLLLVIKCTFDLSAAFLLFTSE